MRRGSGHRPSALAGEGGRRRRPGEGADPALSPRTDSAAGARPRSAGSPPPPGQGLVLLGEFGRAHGLKGEVRLKSFTGDPEAIASYGPLVAGTGRTVTLKRVRPAPGAAPDLLIAEVEGVTDRTAAEALNGVSLLLPREKLPKPEEDEFLLADLVGLAVESPAGETIGTVVAVPNYGGGDLLEIAAPDGATALLPFTRAFVPVVDLEGRRIVADPPPDLFAPAGPEDDGEAA